MNIEDKSPYDITTEDINSLIGQKERPRLDFKKIPWSENLEILRDVCSMANADGGIIVVGTETVGEQCTAIIHVQNADSVAQRIRQVVLDGIEDRILDFSVRVIQATTSVQVLCVYVPSSFAKPHMIKVEKKTEFWKRYETDKRSMTLAEIRLACANTSGVMTLERIEKKVDHLHQQSSEKIQAEAEKKLAEIPEKWHKIRDPKVLLDEIDKRFTLHVGKRRALRLTATPLELKGELVNPSNDEMIQFLSSPPGQRSNGWNMRPLGDVLRTPQGFESNRPWLREILLLRNGHFEFRNEIDEDFSWKQNAQEFQAHPLLYPLPITEFPVSFLRFVKALYGKIKYEGRILWRMHYYNIRGCQIRPYHPQAIGYSIEDARIIDKDNLFVENELEKDFDPDPAALSLISDLYFVVGFSREHIPFFDGEGHYAVPN